MSEKKLVRRLAHRFDVPLQVASFLLLLIKNEIVDANLVYDELGAVDLRGLAYKLRKGLKNKHPDVMIQSRKRIGYWLPDTHRKQFHTEIAE
jgi:hypothetical protein